MQEFIPGASIVRYTASQTDLEAYGFYDLGAIRKFTSERILASSAGMPFKASEMASKQASNTILLLLWEDL